MILGLVKPSACMLLFHVIRWLLCKSHNWDREPIDFQGRTMPLSTKILRLLFSLGVFLKVYYNPLGGIWQWHSQTTSIIMRMTKWTTWYTLTIMMMWMIFFYMKMASGADYTLVITSVTMEDDAKFQCQVFQNNKNSSCRSSTRPCWSFDRPSFKMTSRWEQPRTCQRFNHKLPQWPLRLEVNFKHFRFEERFTHSKVRSRILTFAVRSRKSNMWNFR